MARVRGSKVMRGNGLGQEVRRLLEKAEIETPISRGLDNPRRKVLIEEQFRIIMKLMNLNLKDDSLQETPARVAKMYCDEILYGLDYENFPKCTVIENKMQYDEMISQRCTVMSLCEHHFVPFTGIAYIAYIPKTRVIGLSKMNRIVDFFSRRPQVQERLTVQICTTLQHILQTDDVAVVIRAEHLCVKLRGVKDEQSHTTTSKMSGRFLNNPPLRGEFLSLTR